MKRVKRFGVFQTAKVASVIYFLISAIILFPIGLIFSMLKIGAMPFPFSGGVFFFAIPFLYGFLGFLMTAIGCVVYNFVVKWTGGIEIEIETSAQEI